MRSDDPLLLDRRGPVGWLVFNRPDTGNAMDAAMMERLPQAWAELAADNSVAAIVVTGSGRSFQTGLDVRQLSRDPQALRAMSRRTRQADLRLTGWHLGVGKPVVTAVNGVCAGGGLHFVADSDVVLASETATFLDPHVSLGQVSAFESIGMARRAAFGTVARMALTGAQERIRAREARRLGWVSEVVAAERLAGRAQELAEAAARHPRSATARKTALWHALETGLTEAKETRG
ncbi:enoyl-CoA hydratase/isomerase family protein [Streptomyces sp. WMMC500]|uniref:enoyl-CoA hydratase/isomerase family protein n=1 Tax=Streptomyces sp. WMMC500 TaxID=3015154 RepID=UPI00248D253C|nr:enoyl-CoA hydratase/isomerase family protein [Streptomyces sp. WMMC500]WBB61247.1 enoyl-CoA hydratase/isomerase family protein [Streptomyces sp. WMMC500]